jgi:hypothetical protein
MEVLDENDEVQENPARDMVTRKSMEHDIITADQASGCTDSQ